MATDADELDAFTLRVEGLEAADAADPRVWSAAHQLKFEIRAFDAQVPDFGTPEGIAFNNALDALVLRCAVLDLSPTFAAEFSKLAEYESLNRASIIAQGLLSVVEAFACQMEDKLRAENAKAPANERALVKLERLARRSRSVVFSR